MNKNRLGRTGLEASEIAFGGGVTGGILIEPNEVARVNALLRAVAAGINWIDTAPLYGNGASEETIGRHLAALHPRPHISTKVRIEPEDFDDLDGVIERSLVRSLERLGVSRVALFQLHNQLGAAVGDRPQLSAGQVLETGGVADIFDRLKEQGLCLATGITAAGDSATCIEVIDSGRFDCAQVYYNAINPSAAWSRRPRSWRAQDFSGVINACFHQDMGILNFRVWAGGPLATSKWPERLSIFTSGTDLENEMRCAAAVHKTLGEEYGTPAQVALRFVLGNRDFATRLIGISRIADLDDALEAIEMGPLPSAALAKLAELWANDFRK